MSPGQWQEWLDDETTALQSKFASQASGGDIDQDDLEEDREFTLQLYEAATAEFLSVDTWLSYLQFAMSLPAASEDNADETVSRVREIGEKALAAAGLHLSQAGRLWDAYRAYEQALASAGWGGADTVEKVRTLFHRQLKVPLMGMEATLEGYAEWEEAQGTTGGVPAAVQAAYDAALQLREIRFPLEEMLGAEDATEDVLSTTYSAYIKTEEATSDTSRITYMFERALAALPSKEALWVRYIAYAEETLKVVRALPGPPHPRSSPCCSLLPSLLFCFPPHALPPSLSLLLPMSLSPPLVASSSLPASPRPIPFLPSSDNPPSPLLPVHGHDPPPPLPLLTCLIFIGTQVPDLIQSVCQRAARNCYASGSMWARFMSAVERLGVSDDDLAEIYKSATSHKLKVRRRRISEGEGLRRGRETECVRARARVCVCVCV